MTGTARRTTPPTRTVVAEQVRFVGLALRRDAAIGAALLTALLMVPLYDQPINFTREFGLWAATLGFVTPFGVWRRVGRDGHLWTLPVEHRRLALSGVFAGWCWLMMASAALLAWAALVVLRTDGSFVLEQTRAVLSSSAPQTGPLERAHLSLVTWRTPTWFWFLPFTAATVAYLLGSAVMLCTERVRRWIGGVGLVLLFVLLLGRGAGSGVLSALLIPVATHRYGLETVFAGGPMGQGMGQVVLATGEKLLVWRSLPTLGHWAGATMLWLALGFIALWAATLRYRERGPGHPEEDTRP